MTRSRSSRQALCATALTALTVLAIVIVMLLSATRAEAHTCATKGDVITACGSCTSGTHRHYGPDGLWCGSNGVREYMVLQD